MGRWRGRAAAARSGPDADAGTRSPAWRPGRLARRALRALRPTPRPAGAQGWGGEPRGWWGRAAVGSGSSSSTHAPHPDCAPRRAKPGQGRESTAGRSPASRPPRIPLPIPQGHARGGVSEGWSAVCAVLNLKSPESRAREDVMDLNCTNCTFCVKSLVRAIWSGPYR